MHSTSTLCVATKTLAKLQTVFSRAATNYRFLITKIRSKQHCLNTLLSPSAFQGKVGVLSSKFQGYANASLMRE